MSLLLSALSPDLSFLQAIIATYLVGICGFVYVLPRWTSTDGNLYWPREGDKLLSGKY